MTVTYSPGPHLDRFLASLSHATERPVTRDHGRQRFHRRRARGGARALSQRATAAHRRQPRLRQRGRTAPSPSYAEGLGADSDFFIVANPDVQWGPRSIDVLLEAASPLAAGRLARAADPRPGRLGVPVGAPPAQPHPRRHARGRRADVEVQSVDRRHTARSGWSPANVPSAGCRDRACCCAGAAFDEIARVRRALLHVHGGRRPGRPAGRRGLAERLRAVGGGFARQGPCDRPGPGAQLGGPSHEHLHFPGRSAFEVVAGDRCGGRSDARSPCARAWWSRNSRRRRAKGRR